MPNDMKQVNGMPVELTDAEQAVRDSDAAAALTEATLAVIRTECERRIAAGVVLSPSGMRFRCDTMSITRIQGMKDAPSGAFPITFKTYQGVTVTVADAGAAGSVFDQAASYVAAVLAASSALQDDPPADPLDDQHWPADGS